MVKNITIGVLTLISLSLLVFSFLKANDAEKQKMEAIRAMTLATKNAEEARVQEQKSLEVVMASKAEADSLRFQLLECQNK